MRGQKEEGKEPEEIADKFGLYLYLSEPVYLVRKRIDRAILADRMYDKRRRLLIFCRARVCLRLYFQRCAAVPPEPSLIPPLMSSTHAVRPP